MRLRASSSSKSAARAAARKEPPRGARRRRPRNGMRGVTSRPQPVRSHRSLRTVFGTRGLALSAALNRSAMRPSVRPPHAVQDCAVSACRPPPALADAPFGPWLRPARAGVLGFALLTRASLASPRSRERPRLRPARAGVSLIPRPPDGLRNVTPCVVGRARSLADAPFGPALRAARSLANVHDVDAAVLGPRRLVVAFAARLFLAEAHRLDLDFGARPGAPAFS